MKRPQTNEYAPFHATYIKILPPRVSAKTLLNQTWKETMLLFGKLPEVKGDFCYESNKWSIKQLLVHMIDTERVFAFRILWFMRGDRAPLPGFNQDFWMEYANVSDRSIKSLLKEWKLVRDHTLFLLNICSEAQSMQTGMASGFKFSVRAYFYIIAGHHLHHLTVYKERYM